MGRGGQGREGALGALEMEGGCGCRPAAMDPLSPPGLFAACCLERGGRGWAGNARSWDGIEMGRRVGGGWGWAGLGWEEEEMG